MLHNMRRRAEAEGAGEFDFIVGLVRPVPAHPFAGPELDGGVGVFSGQLGHIVGDAVFVDVGRLVKRKVMPAFTTAWRCRTSLKYSSGMSVWVKTSKSGSQVMVVPVFFRSAGETFISPMSWPFSKWRS